jgi:hypothetical protein
MSPPVRYFALFGPRACGKTVYLGAIYGSSRNRNVAGEEYHVGTSHEPTHEYLNRACRALIQGSWPQTTPFDGLKRMSLDFTSHGSPYRLMLPDVGGEVTRRAVDSSEKATLEAELKAQILREFQDYHGFIIFAPVGDEPVFRSVEYKWEVDVLLQALKERTQDGGMISRPVAVLVSKWDLLGAIDEKADDEATKYFEKAYPELAAGLKATCKNLSVFPISSTGPLVDGKPPVPLRPYNLGAPLEWLVQASDRMMLDQVEDYLRASKGRLFEKDENSREKASCYRVAQQRIRQFLQEVPRGPLAEVARQHRRELRRRSRVRSLKIVALAFLSVCAVVSMAGLVWDRDTYVRTIPLLDWPPSLLAPGEATKQVDIILADRTRVVGQMLGWWPEIQRRKRAFDEKYENASFDKIKRLFPPVDPDAARRLVESIDEFEAQFKGSSHIADVEEFRKKARKKIRDADEFQAFIGIQKSYAKFKEDKENGELIKNLREDCVRFLDSYKGTAHCDEVQNIRVEMEAALIRIQPDLDYVILEAELRHAADNPLKCFHLCSAFIEKWPKDSRTASLRSRRATYQKQADDHAWNEVLAFAREYPNLYSAQLDKCEAYLANSIFTVHRAEATKFKTDATRSLDRSDYEVIRDRAREGNEPETLEAVHNLCLQYLKNTSNPIKAMKSDVENWCKWFDSWDVGRDFYVAVNSVEVKHGSQWHYTFYWPTVWVEIGINCTTFKTGSKCINLDRDERGLPDNWLGPFHWRWGERKVAVWIKWLNANPPEFPSDFAKQQVDPFLVRHLNGEVEYDGGKIRVRLECPEVVPPTLAPYMD